MYHGLSGTLRFPPGSVLVVRVLLHVHGPQPLRLVNERPLLHLRQELPLCTQPLGDLRVVHLRVVQGDLPALYPRPDHERVHRTLDVLLALRVHAWRHREARVTVTVRTRHVRTMASTKLRTSTRAWQQRLPSWGRGLALPTASLSQVPPPRYSIGREVPGTELPPHCWTQ